MKKLIILFCVLLFLQSFCIGQNLDSLWKVYNNQSQADTNRIKAIQVIAWSYRSNKPDTAIVLAEQEIKFVNALPNGKGRKWAADALNTIGAAFTNKGNFPKALNYYLQSLKIFEETGNKKGTGICYSNVGNIYWYQTNYPKAIDYYLKALQLYKEVDYKKGVAACYTNIGAVYFNQTNYPKALDYQLKSLSLRDEIDDKIGVGLCYANIGLIYKELSNFPKALSYQLKSLQIRKVIGDKGGEGICYSNMSEIYNSLANYKLAILYSDSAMYVSKETGDIDGERYAYQNLATAYSKTGKYKEAYENHVKFKQLTDSIFNADNSKQLGDIKTKFEVEKKEAELKIKAEAQEAINKEEKQKQQLFLGLTSLVLVLVVVFAVFMYRRFKITQKQKHIIELQKDEVSRQKEMVDKAYAALHEKNEEVMASIRYAKRIQDALMTSEKYIHKTLNRLMGGNKPKD
ncbi:MAG TPA: tetratricopeptide repeat protein [Bacteroidia bacterium]